MVAFACEGKGRLQRVPPPRRVSSAALTDRLIQAIIQPL